MRIRPGSACTTRGSSITLIAVLTAGPASDEFRDRIGAVLNDQGLWTWLWWKAFRLRALDALSELAVADPFSIERFVKLYASAISAAGFDPDDPTGFDVTAFHQTLDQALARTAGLICAWTLARRPGG